MGVYDRDYYRREGPSFLGSITETGKMCKTLIVVNVIVFACQVVFYIGQSMVDPEGAKRGMADPFTELFWLRKSDVLEHGYIWQLLTAAFLHSLDIWHIGLNMLVLWWFGTEVEDIYGPKEFLAIYLTGAVGSGIFYLLWEFVTGSNIPAVGASGAVSAIFVLFACHYPYRIIRIMFIIPCPVWLLAVLYIGSDVLDMATRSADGVGHAAHVGGALLGFGYYHGKFRLLNLVPDWKAWKLWRKRRQQPRLRVFRGEPEPEAITPVPVSATPPMPRAEIDEHLEAKLDAVLEKVARVGKENLTDSERDILQRASELYRRRRS